MVPTDKLLVVVNIHQGKKFPRRAKHKLVVETKFDGEHLETDPVDHVEEPDIATELAWELDRKSLHLHKLQRTPLKLQIFDVDTVKGSKEQMGYVMLDLRMAQSQGNSRWLPLLSNRYGGGLRPQLLIGIYLEDDGSGGKHLPQSGGSEVVRGRPGTAGGKALVPTLNQVGGFYQIGPEAACREMFLFSVTLASARNLAALVPLEFSLPRDTPFHFRYELLGNAVTNDHFRDLLTPDMTPERSSLRLRSNPRALRSFFAELPPLVVQLCCADSILGATKVPVSTLLQGISNLNQPVSMESMYALSVGGDGAEVVPDQSQPCIEVVVQLRREGSDAREPSPNPSPIKQKMSPSKRRAKNKTGHKSGAKKRSGDEGTGDRWLGVGDELGTDHGVPSLKDETGGQKQRGHKGVVGQSPEGGGEPKWEAESPKGGQVRSPEGGRVRSPGGKEGGAISRSTPPRARVPAPHPPQPTIPASHPIIPTAPGGSHHFSFSIDLRSLSDLHLASAHRLYLRYSFPFFGSSAPIQTQPPVAVGPNMEVLLPNSFCAFDFACSQYQLQETFVRVPLMVEVWSRDSSRPEEDQLVAVVWLPLGQVLATDSVRIAADGERGTGGGTRQTLVAALPVLATAAVRDASPVGQLNVVLSLTDHGVIATQESPVATSRESLATAAAHSPPSRDTDQRNTAEYKTAMELELWKEQQEKIYERSLKEKEVAHMKALAEEWKKRDKERELIVKKKVVEYSGLQEQLRVSLAEVEKREKYLEASELEVGRLKQDLQREHERRLGEMVAQSARLDQDCRHQGALVEARAAAAERQTKELERRLVEKELELREARAEAKPKAEELGLKSEVTVLRLDKAEVERKLDAAVKSKNHYKQQWGRALKELARIRQDEHNEAKEMLEKQRDQIESMKIHKQMSNDKENLESLKRELEKLKEVSEKSMVVKDVDGGKNNVVDSVDEHITRLIEERDTLLRTGVYTTHDKIIAELERQIKDCIAKKHTK